MRDCYIGVLCTILALSAGGLIGCEREVEHTETIKRKSDGTTVREEKTVKEHSDGTVTKEERKSVDRPNP